MYRSSLKRTFSGFIYSGLLLTPAAYAESTPEEILLQQIQVGESINRSDIVEQALYRLESIDPKNPDYIAAKIRQSLRQQNRQQALADLELLNQVAPNSDLYKQTKIVMDLNSEDGQQKLEEARLLARTGRLQEAQIAYDNIFKGTLPTVNLAVEYWQLISRLPGQQARAMKQLQDIDRKTPGNPELRNALVAMLFEQGNQQQGFALLQLMAADSNTKDSAATIWLDQIKAMPVSRDSINSLKLYLTFYSDGEQNTNAQQLLSQQEKDLATPGFVARQTGLALVEQGKGNAIPALSQAMKDNPNDAEVVGSLGLAYSKQGNRSMAVSLLERAVKLDSGNDKWLSPLKTNRYWLLIQQGDTALAAGNTNVAENKYRQAHSVDSTDTEALLGLGDVAIARKDDNSAERYYQQVIKQEPQNSRAMGKLVDIYQRQSPEKALAYLESLSQRQRLSMNAGIKSFRSDLLQKEADVLEQQQQLQQAVVKLREAPTAYAG